MDGFDEGEVLSITLLIGIGAFWGGVCCTASVRHDDDPFLIEIRHL